MSVNKKMRCSATWYQMTLGSKLLAGTDMPTKRRCIECFCDGMAPTDFRDVNHIFHDLKKKGYDCVKVTGFWEVTK